MSELLQPTTAEAAREAVAWALAEEAPLEIAGAGSKRELGRPMQTSHRLELSGLTGVSLYEPEELVLSAAAGTPLAEIEGLLAEHDQQLAFEPADYGPLYGRPAGAQTIGGVIACNLAGPRRIKAGAARDHFLGVHAVNGRGEAFKAGGRVVKNVTGYDMCKLLAGSHGTLAVLTEVTIKVMPAPEKTRTLLATGLDDAAAARVMSEALRSPHEVSAAAHLPRALAAASGVSYVKGAGAAVTAVRVEGPGPSVDHRSAALRERIAAGLGAGQGVEELHSRNSAAFWRELKDAAPLGGRADDALWRISVPPLAGPGVVAAIAEKLDVAAFYDWGGGLVWLALPADAAGDAGAAPVREAVAQAGSGHAALIRAPLATRAAVPVFQPQPPALAGLSARIKESFDPRGILNPGRMYAGV